MKTMPNALLTKTTCVLVLCLVLAARSATAMQIFVKTPVGKTITLASTISKTNPCFSCRSSKPWCAPLLARSPPV